MQHVYPIINEGNVISPGCFYCQVTIQDAEADNHIGGKLRYLALDFYSMGENQGNIIQQRDFNYSRANYCNPRPLMNLEYIVEHLPFGIKLPFVLVSPQNL